MWTFEIARTLQREVDLLRKLEACKILCLFLHQAKPSCTAINAVKSPSSSSPGMSQPSPAQTVEPKSVLILINLPTALQRWGEKTPGWLDTERVAGLLWSFQVVFFGFQIIFLYPTGGGEGWHQPRPGLWLWDRSDQQARPAAGFQECGAGGYDGEFPGWGPKLPAGQGGQSRDVLLQKPPGIYTSPTKIWRHLDSVGFRLVLCDPSGLTSHRTCNLGSEEFSVFGTSS